MKCSDIPETPILEFLLENKGRWATTFEGYGHSIDQSFPPGTPYKLILAKMAKLIKRGLVSGCACGCRGDFKITEKGIQQLNPLL